MSTPPLEKPILALTLAIAGKRDVDEQVRQDLDSALNMILDQVARGLADCRAQARPGGALGLRFSDRKPARLTLLTGLADGTDQIAGRLFRAAGEQPGVERLLGAILPCDARTFVEHSPVRDRATFDEQAAACEFLLELDGEMPAASERGKGDDDTRLRVSRARGAAFNAQSEFLIRHGDVLIAVDDEAAPAQVGGTRQTMRSALEFGLPVVLVRLADPGIAILRTRSDLEEPVQLYGDAARSALTALVNDLIGLMANEFDEDYVRHLLEEFFGEGTRGGWLGLRGSLPKVWSAFESRFSEKRPARPSQQATEPYLAHRRRASELSSHYAGLYRGSFLVGYGLAVAAVGLAVLSQLTLLWITIGRVSHEAGPAILMGLGLLKLLAVIGMTLLAKHAHDRHLSHRAADYRYLSERLRAMIFLPHVGSLRAPPHLSQPYATRVATQGIIDRLFDSIARQAEPLKTLGAAEGKTIRPDAQAAMRVVGSEWIAVQGDYHHNNAIVLQGMTHWLESGARRLNGLIIAIVLIDLALVALDMAGLVPHMLSTVLHQGVEPVLIAMAAILPAAVASMNGVRFQSEFSRLADRSEQMKYELAHLEKRARMLWQRSDRMLDVLHVAEDAARLTLDEVADWTALYGKEFLEM